VRVTRKDQRHVLDRHRSDSPSRSTRLFPTSWSEEKILTAVEATADEPQNVVTDGHFVIRYRHVDGVIVPVTSSHFPLDALANFESGSPHSGDTSMVAEVVRSLNLRGGPPGSRGCPRNIIAMAFSRITINPGKMNGLPCIRDTRVSVSAVLGQLAAERSVEQILEDHPYLERADVVATLEFAAAAMQERELPLADPA
jgi:uncharacterized protein (DUF433 family)